MVNILYRSFSKPSRSLVCAISRRLFSSGTINNSFSFNAFVAQATMPTLMSKPEFLSRFPAIKRSVTSFYLANGRLRCPKIATSWIEKLLDYNVPNGKLNRGLTFVHSYQCLNSETSGLNLDSVCKLGWAVELLETCFLMADDVMDASITRRGRPCWFRNKDVGLSAINDSFLLENAVDLIIHEVLKDQTCYVNVLQIFREVKLITMLGQHLDTQPFNWDMCTKDRYLDITRCKTSYYTFLLPILAAVRMSPHIGNEYDDEIRELCMAIGYFFQCQDDYLDCFGDPEITGKIGMDIEDGKCTWLFVEALEYLTPDQKETLKKFYAKRDESSVKVVKNLYESIDLQKKYRDFEREQVQILTSMVEKLTLVELKPLFTHLLTLLSGRNK